VTGTVNSRGWPIVRVTVYHPSGPYRQDLDVMVDTGCEVELVLSTLDIAALGLPYWRTQAVQFGDGSSRAVGVHDALIDWFGTRHPIKVYESANRPGLLGARLLAPRTLVIDYGAGTVEIR
jgi:predicted aspartyl protease